MAYAMGKQISSQVRFNSLYLLVKTSDSLGYPNCDQEMNRRRF